ncbi:uncharacterized protein BO95DRAFT_94451 [Aspergillus brunneoviolaceus CBS 621.78]|uniref:Uncharacterized protein n=1 Tax=Aspergillus brunneoviolaceus CBS 621.78 TaxID=1450534 RepID=A0ACD1GCU1_9EURO|nr:hypothetical protein BO95DRAFT_94451 [Aspergillus brunneoviolaceus CBS 621.78]RAH47005.1 hypothetical protein BO95DRAFT_94451 [Aspergillus brunneoviolaceus CBS 621.78]
MWAGPVSDRACWLKTKALPIDPTRARHVPAREMLCAFHLLLFLLLLLLYYFYIYSFHLNSIPLYSTTLEIGDHLPRTGNTPIQTLRAASTAQYKPVRISTVSLLVNADIPITQGPKEDGGLWLGVYSSPVSDRACWLKNHRRRHWPQPVQPCDKPVVDIVTSALDLNTVQSIPKPPGGTIYVRGE